MQKKLLLHKVSRNATWGEAASLLTPKEWGTFANEMDVKWGVCFKRSLKRECKRLPGANLREDFDMRSRHSTCPFTYRDVPCYIDQQGNPNLEDYVWVQVRAIKDPKVLKEWAKEFQLADGFEWPTYNMIKSTLNKNSEDTGMFHGHPSSGWMHFKDVITSVMRRVKTRHPTQICTIWKRCGDTFFR